MHSPMTMEEIDEAEETLSFCDLSIYTDAASDWDVLSKGDQSSSSFSSSSDDQDYFEFSSQEWSSSSPPDKVLFCGKIIPSKQPISADQINLKKRSLYRWNSDSFYNHKPNSKLNDTNGTKGRKFSSSISFNLPEKSGEKIGKLVPRGCIETSPAKSRWYLFMIGLGRFPAEMEMREIRRRQSRKIPAAAMFRTDGGGEDGGCRRSRGKGLWGLIRDFSFGKHRRAKSRGEGSFARIPRV